MWTCEKCGENITDEFRECFHCARVEGNPASPQSGRRCVAYKYFESGFDSWDAMFTEASEYATRIGPGRLINISHSSDRGTGVVTVWYWE